MSKTKQHTIYRLTDGSKVVGVTTLIGAFVPKPALYRWYYKQGCEGKDPFKMLDQAGTIGTIAHYLIECHLKRIKPELADYSKNDIEKAENAFVAYLEFEKQNNIEVIANELQLASEKYLYGGTCDLIAKVNGITTLMDFKTSSGLWPDMRIQLAAYKNLLIEHGYDIQQVHLLRIDKETGEFHHHKLENLDSEWELFKLFLQAYPLKNKIWGDK
jgi:hypothetical protein